MDLSISNVVREDPDPRIELLVGSQDIELSMFALYDNTFNESGPSNVFRHFFRFAQRRVFANSVIILHLGVGTDHQSVFAQPEIFIPNRFDLYWDANASIINEFDTIHLIRVNDIDSYPRR